MVCFPKGLCLKKKNTTITPPLMRGRGMGSWLWRSALRGHSQDLAMETGRGAGSCPAGKRTWGGRSLCTTPLPTPATAFLAQGGSWRAAVGAGRPAGAPPPAPPSLHAASCAGCAAREQPLLTPPALHSRPEGTPISGFAQGPRETEGLSEPPPGMGKPWSEPSPCSHLSQVHGE